ncbi:hypothetical protein ACFFJN_04280, partial [Erwinia mallotivora]
MIEHLLARTGLFLGLFASGLIFLSFFLYLPNKNNYENLVSLFKEKYTFPAPNSFNYMMGFFGVFQVSRFFIKLRGVLEILCHSSIMHIKRNDTCPNPSISTKRLRHSS